MIHARRGKRAFRAPWGRSVCAARSIEGRFSQALCDVSAETCISVRRPGSSGGRGLRPGRIVRTMIAGVLFSTCLGQTCYQPATPLGAPVLPSDGPIADAGADQAVNSGDSVTLNALAS